ncbi:MAG TPA: ABC transporter permease [Vicinamibacterales bacterium]
MRAAMRGLRQHPGFAALAIVIIGLAAGANAVVYPVVRAVLLDPLPFTAPERLTSIAPNGFVSNADIDFLRARARSFDAVAALSPGWTMTLDGAGEPARVTADKTSANLFDTLGVRPLIGRTFVANEDAPGRTRVAILSYRLWQTQFSADPRVVGRTVTLEGAPHEIIGVMDREFELFGRDAELWMPLAFDRTSPFWKGTVSRAIARLRSGADPELATNELRALIPAWQRALDYPKDWGHQMIVTPLREAIVGDARLALVVLATAVGIVLILTAANLGTLLLGRQIGRRRESAVRAALGASTIDIFRQTIIESLVLTFAGTLAGLAVAWIALPVVVHAIPPEIPRQAAIRIDAGVFGVVLAMSCTAAIVLGVVPSLWFARPSHEFLRAGSTQSPAPGARRSLDVLVIGQVSASVVLAAAAALTVRSLAALQHVDPGFVPQRVLTLKLQPSRDHVGTAAEASRYYSDVMAHIAAIAGVERVGAINHLPLSGFNWTTSITRDDRPLPPGVSPPNAGWRMIAGAYFDAMRIPLVAGRTFDDRDGATTPPVAVVNDALARRFFDDAPSAIGRRIRTGTARSTELVTIIGVVGNVRHVSLMRSPEPELYRPIGQSLPIAAALAIRTSVAPESIAASVRRAVRSVDGNVTIADMASLPVLLQRTLARPRFIALLLALFAGAGLAILLSGVYGVVAYTTGRRQREIGIRVALGAAPMNVARLILRQGGVYAIAGVAVGAPIAIAAAGFMRGVLFGIQPRDPLTIAALCAVVGVATLAATAPAAIRAVKLDPASVLKNE